MFREESIGNLFLHVVDDKSDDPDQDNANPYIIIFCCVSLLLMLCTSLLAWFVMPETSITLSREDWIFSRLRASSSITSRITLLRHQ